MILLCLLSLSAALMYRLGWFRPLQEYRKSLTFNTQVYTVAEEVEWDERMTRFRTEHREINSRPGLHFRDNRKRR